MTWVYLAIVGVVACERLVELVISKRNSAVAFARGGKEFGRGHLGVMVALHTLFLFAAPAEVLLLDRPVIPWLFGAMVLLLCGTMTLRYWAIGTLGQRWNTRVIVVPGLSAVSEGPYRFLRHPNYVAVVLELLAIPLMHNAWLTAVVFGLCNLALLKVRIDCEERALREVCGYDALEERPRGLP